MSITNSLCSTGLARLACGAVLSDILLSIATECERGIPFAACAIYLLDRNNQLQIGAAPSLSKELSTSITEIEIDPTEWENITWIDSKFDRSTPAYQIRHIFYDHTAKVGVFPRLIVPIRLADGRLSGVFFLFNENVNNDVDVPPAIAQVVNLIAIAISAEESRVRLAHMENRIEETESEKNRMALAIEGSATGIWDRDIGKNKIDYSSGWKAILGYGDSDSLSNKIEESYTRVHPEDLDFVRTAIQNHFDQKTDSYEVDHRILCKDGSYKWISSRGKVVSRDPYGVPLRMVGTTTDISAIRAISDRLQQSIDLITSLTNEIPGLVYQYRLHPNGEEFFSYVSEGAHQIYELMPDQIATDASLLHQRIHPEDFANYRRSLEISARHLTPWQLEYRVVLPRQGLKWCYGSAQPRRAPDGSILWHGFISDITERKRIELELKEFATIDFLTQLPNRRYFMGRMEEELARVKRIASTRTTVLMCDLDFFKSINDRFGHAVGDLVLKHFASTLSVQLRNNDMVGRVGGEEFAVILSDVTPKEAHVFALRLQQEIANIPLIINDKALHITVSIGIASIDANDVSADASLLRSDRALYRAKENGRNRIEFADI